jgi:hypothetical protein
MIEWDTKRSADRQSPFQPYKSFDLVTTWHHINRSDFFDTITSSFEFIEFTRFEDRTKPNDVVILRSVTAPTGTIPKTQSIHMRGLMRRVARAITPGFGRTAIRRVIRS